MEERTSGVIVRGSRGCLVYHIMLCNCSAGCTNRKCRCITAGIPCTSACHAGKICKNTHEKESAVVVEEPWQSSVLENIPSGEQLTDEVISEAMCGLHPPAAFQGMSERVISGCGLCTIAAAVEIATSHKWA